MKNKKIITISIFLFIVLFSIVFSSNSKNNINNYIDEVDNKNAKKIFLYKEDIRNSKSNKTEKLENKNSKKETDNIKTRENIKIEEKTFIEEINLEYKDSQEITEKISGINGFQVIGLDNKIIIIGKEKDIEEIKIISNIIKSLDIPKNQIIIRGRIIDTSSNLFERIGVNWAINDENGVPNKPNLLSKFLNGEVSIGSIFASGGHFLGIDFNFLRENGDIKIDSMPTLMVMEKEEGELKITEEVLIGEKKTTKNNIEYTEPIFSEAGIVFKILPEVKIVDNEKKILLKIDTEISNFKLTSSYSEKSGAKQKNQTKTIITLDNGSSTFIGGLNQNVGKETVRKIPLLADISIIGPLFRYKRKNQEMRDIFIEIEALIKE